MATKYSSSSVERAFSEATRKLSFDELKSKQKEAVVTFVSGNDTFVVLPTGYGKLAIYAVLLCVFVNILSTHSAFIPFHASLRLTLIFHAGQSKNGARDFY